MYYVCLVSLFIVILMKSVYLGNKKVVHGLSAPFYYGERILQQGVECQLFVGFALFRLWLPLALS